MHERGRPERRLSGKRAIQFDAEDVADGTTVDCGDFHEEVVRVLAIVQRPTAIRLATLEQQRKLQLAAGGGRLGREHGPEGELSSEERV